MKFKLKFPYLMKKVEKIFFDSYQKLTENGILSSDVNFDELSTLTKNFTGAEIEGLCNSAKSYAISRHTKRVH